MGLHPQYVKRDDKWITIDEAGGWRYKHNENYYPNSKQVKIWKHYEAGIKAVRNFRNKTDCDLLIVGMGDMIDGDHHQTHQLTTRIEGEQMNAHVEIMTWTKEALNFDPSRDKLVYIEGTESHTRDNEEQLAQRLGAQQFSRGYCVPFLELTVHGKLCWFFHHGVASGYSYSSGNSLWGYLKKIYYDRKANNKPVPDLITTAHTHKADHQIFIHNGHEVHGIICPPLQEKTRFTNKIATAIVHETKLGLSPFVIYPNGFIQVLPPFLMEMPLGDKLIW